MATGTRRKLWLAVETAVALVIVAAVAWNFRNTLRGIEPGSLPIQVRAELLVPAGVLYLLAHLCWSAFWVRLLHSQGVPVSWWVGLRTYYISQFGKYIPGKVAVLAMRVVMLRHHGGHPIPVAVTATYETLTSMAAGALLAVLFLPALGVLPPEISGNRTALFAVVALPLGLAMLNKLAARIAKKRRGPDARPLPAPSLFLLAQGLLHGAAGYCLLALSLGLTVRGLVPDAADWDAVAFTRDVAAVALAYVAGFVFVIAPGGLGARELALKWALAPQFAAALGAVPAAQVAVLIALALRLAWTVAEVAVGLLFYALKPALPPPHPHPVEVTTMTDNTFPGANPPRAASGFVALELISLVIPVYNERESLAALHAEIAEVAGKMADRVEVVFVDDGSKDGSWDVIRDLAAKDERVRGIRFRRNFGKAAALAAGFAAARGAVVVTMDADLQDDPHEVPRFLEAVRGGRDVVSGWKKVRHDPWHKVFPSRVFNRFLSVVTGVHLHDHNCGMKAYRAEALKELYLYGELHRFVPVLAAARGFSVGELVIHHRARQFGRSKYGWKRFIKGALDVATVRLLTGFGRRPNHLLGTWGLAFGALGVFGYLVLLANALVRLFDGTLGIGPLGQLAGLILATGSVLVGVQCLLAGLVCEMTVARQWLANDPYSVAEDTSGEPRGA